MTGKQAGNTNQWKHILIIVCCAVILIGGFVIATTSRNVSDTGNKMEKVVVAQWGQEKYLIYLPLYIAMEKRFFEEEGLDISLTYSGNDDQVFASVLQGGAQFGVGDPVFTAIANEKGGELGKVVASIVDGVAIWGVTNKQKLKNIHTRNQLSGLRIGTFPAPSTNYTLMAETIKTGGRILESTKIIEAPIGGQIALLESGQADIAMVLEPAASIAESEGFRVVFSSPEFYGPFAFTGLTVSTSFADSHPKTVQGMVNALQRSLRYCHRNPKDAVAIACKLFPSVDRKVIERAVQRMISEKTIPEKVLVSEEAWTAALSTRVTVGDLKVLQPYTESVDPSPAEAAMKEYP